MLRRLCPITNVLFLGLWACGPSSTREAEEARDVDWLAEHAKLGELEAVSSLCKLALDGAEGASTALAAARVGKDPSRYLEAIGCMTELGLKGETPFVAATREHLASHSATVRLAALNALDAAGVDAALRAGLKTFLPDLALRLRDEEDAVWRRALNIIYNQGPEGRSALVAVLQIPEPTRRRDATRRLADFREIAAEIGPPALAWISDGESDVFDRLVDLVVRSRVTIAAAQPSLLGMLQSGADPKIESGLVVARRLAEEGRCSADVVRAVLSVTTRTTCEEPCLSQARGVAYRCRQIADAVLREAATRPASDDPEGRPGEIGRATLGL